MAPRLAGHPSTFTHSFLQHSDQDGEANDDFQRQDRIKRLISVNSKVPLMFKNTYSHQRKNNSKEAMKIQQLIFFIINFKAKKPGQIIWTKIHWWL